MVYIITTLLLAATIALLAVRASRAAKTDDAPPAKEGVQPIKRLSRAEIAKRLGKLSKSKAVRESRGAMCYDQAMPPQRAEYVCPVCGSKTVYCGGPPDLREPGCHRDSDGTGLGGQSLAQLIEWGLDHARRLIPEIRRKGLDAVLDESTLCRKCRPDALDPGLRLSVRYPGEAKPRPAVGVDDSDLDLILEFLKGKEQLDGPEQTPMKEKLPRLRELLGLPEK
ncbi:MAG: hypothetical protein WC728_07715 [Elusimicrobiota bacterium]